MRQFWIYAVVALAVVGVVYAFHEPSKEDVASSDFDELEDCSALTSLDGTKSLNLWRNHRAAFSDSSGLGLHTSSGTWAQIDADHAIYRITLDGVAQDYRLASAPAGEGCMLVAGPLNAADLGKSWFSTMTDSD